MINLNFSMHRVLFYYFHEMTLFRQRGSKVIAQIAALKNIHSRNLLFHELLTYIFRLTDTKGIFSYPCYLAFFYIYKKTFNNNKSKNSE